MTKRFYIISAAILFVIAMGVATWYFLNTARTSDHQTPSGSSTSKLQKLVDDITPLSCVKKLPITTKIGQKIMVAAYSDQLAAETPVLIDAKLDGIIVMNQTDKSIIDGYTSGASITPTIAVDQEGGTVQRYTAEGTLPGAAEMTADFTSRQAYDKYLKDFQYLKSVGITTNFAPLVDVISTTPSALPDRMYSSDPSIVVNYATQAIKASQAAGITPVVKHFPGLGSSSGNTDFGAATTDSLDILKTRDLIPYQQLSSPKPDVMVANAAVPGLTDGQPATWSPQALLLLRGYGYQNVVTYSDSLTARAIPGSLADAVVKAWQAGIDVALIVQTSKETPALQAYLRQIIDRSTSAIASGELDAKTMDQSVLRILERKGVAPCSISQS